MQPALTASSFICTTPVYIRLQLKRTYTKTRGTANPLAAPLKKDIFILTDSQILVKS